MNKNYLILLLFVFTVNCSLPGSAFLGPAFELRHFLDFMNGKGGNGVKMRPLLAAKTALKKLGISLIMMAATVLLSNRFPPQFML